MRRAVAVLAHSIIMVAASLSWAAGPEDCNLLRHHGRRARARECFTSLTRSRDPYLRAEGYWGLEMYEEANTQFRAAVAQSGDNAHYRVRWGRLMHERFNNAEAENLFSEALQRDKKSAEAYLGLALVSADGFDGKAIEWTAHALELDPRLIEAHELMANLALEDSDPQKAAAQADEALKLAPDALDALAIHAAVEVLADRSPQAWLDKLQQVNPTYGEGYALVAHHLILNRRYAEGISYYRKAVELDPRLWSARSQLGINLMRTGQEQEARHQLEMCYLNEYRNDATVNSLRLLDTYGNFVTFKSEHIILKLHKKEADLLRPYFQAELERSIATYEKKYRMKLARPVQVEVYPDHEDFAVRSMGMPGLGALGATFTDVIAMDSPSGRPPGTFHWASTLWHEMSHVFILSATNQRVPRWFTEGLAVHEETEVCPEWGDPVSPDILTALRNKKFLPILELDRGFVHPEYPAQVVVSYFEAGRICDYIKGRWGNDKLLAMVHSFAKRKSTAEVIGDNLGEPPEEFDREFQQWLNKDLGSMAAGLERWHARLRRLAQLAKSGDYDEVIKEGDEVRRMYPQYVYGGNTYELLAEADLAKQNERAAAAVLTDYENEGGRNPETLKQLAKLEEKLGAPDLAAATLDRINYIYPMDEDVHHRLGDLWLGQKKYDAAVREYSAVIAMHPLDTASAHFNLARAYFAIGQRRKAEEQLLTSLEAAPGYRPAQKLLLELEDSGKRTN